MKHVLPFKEKEIEQRRLEAEAAKVARVKQAEGEADARRIEAGGEADSRRKLAEADAFRIDVTGKAQSAQIERDSRAHREEPAADPEDDRRQAVRQDPGDHRAAAGRRLLRGRSHRRERRGAHATAKAGGAPAVARGSEPMLLAALAVTVALVVQDQTPLRAARARQRRRARRCSRAGDWLEVRGERQGYAAGLRPPARAPRLRAARAPCARYAVDEATAPSSGRSSITSRTCRARSRSASGTRRSSCARRPRRSVGPRCSTRSARWPSGSRGALRRAWRRRATRRSPRQLETAESYGVHFVSFEQRGADARLLRRRGVPARARARRHRRAAGARGARA